MAVFNYLPSLYKPMHPRKTTQNVLATTVKACVRERHARECEHGFKTTRPTMLCSETVIIITYLQHKEKLPLWKGFIC